MAGKPGIGGETANAALASRRRTTLQRLKFPSRDSFFDPDLEGVSVTVPFLRAPIFPTRASTPPLGGQNSENMCCRPRLAPVLQREVAARVHLRRATAEIHPRRDRGTAERRVQQHPHRRLTAAACIARAIPFIGDLGPRSESSRAVGSPPLTRPRRATRHPPLATGILPIALGEATTVSFAMARNRMNSPYSLAARQAPTTARER